MNQIKIIIFIIGVCCSISCFSRITDDDYVNTIDSIRGEDFGGFGFFDTYYNRNNQDDDLELMDLSSDSNNSDDTKDILDEDEKKDTLDTPLM